MGKTFQSLRIFNFRILIVTMLLAATGMWMQIFAQDWLVLTILTDNDAAQVGYLTAMQFLPRLFLAPGAGVVADRVDLRRFVQSCQLAIAGIGLIQGALILSGTIQLWHVYILALLLGTVLAFENPARIAFVSEVVPASSLANAVSLNSAAFNVARMIGPAVAGLLTDSIGIGWVFILSGIAYLLPAACFMLIRTNELLERRRIAKERGQIREGFVYIINRTEILMVLSVVLVFSSLGLNMQATSAYMATQVYNIQAKDLGLFGLFLAIGSLIGSLISARRATPRLRTVIIGAGAFGVAQTLLALAPTYMAFLLLAIPTGILALTVINAANVYVQLASEEHIRGRVMSLYSMVFLGMSALGAPVVGMVAAHWGARWSILVGSLSSIAIAVITAMWVYRYRRSQGMRVSLIDSRYRILTTTEE